MSKQPVRAVIENLLSSRELISSGEVAAAAGVTRQAAHYHLRAMTESGLLARVSAGRTARYARRALFSQERELAGLEEDQVWTADLRSLLRREPHLFDNPNLRPVLQYAFTEMLNNAIDHSEGTSAKVRWYLDSERVTFEVEDDGLGVFRKVREDRSLSDDFQAVGELARGKQTTAPERHSGQGIFFTSRLVDKFVLASGQVVWIVDSLLPDEAIGWLDKPRRGTLVRAEVSRTTDRGFADVSTEFSDPETLDFVHSRFRMRLFQDATTFMSRSEAKRVGAHLEQFRSVVLDFDGVTQVGQGFVDELFRVWSNSHPDTELIPVNANPAVSAMISAARSGFSVVPFSPLVPPKPRSDAAVTRSSRPGNPAAGDTTENSEAEP